MKKTIYCTVLFVFSILQYDVSFGQSEQSLISKADSFSNQHDLNGVIAVYTQLIEQFGEKEDYLRSRGLAYLRQEKWSRGALDYSKAIKLNPNCVNCYINMAYIAQNLQLPEIFKTHIDRAISLDDKNMRAYDLRAENYMNSGWYYKAVEDYSKVIQLDPNNPRIYIMRCMCYTSLYELENALLDVNKAIELKPDVEYAYYLRSKIYIQQEHYEKSITDLNRCIKQNQLMPEYLSYRGYAYHMLGELEKSLDDMNSVIALEHTSSSYYLNRSNLYADMLRFEESCLDKKTALHLVPVHQLEVRNLLATEIANQCDPTKRTYFYNKINYALNNQRYVEAEELINLVSKKYKRSPIVFEYRGKLHIMKGEYKRALQSYKLALKHKENLVDEKAMIALAPSTFSEYSALFEATIRESMSFACINLSQFQVAIDHLDSAINVLTQVLHTTDINNITSQAYCKKAVALIALKKVDEAKESLKLGSAVNTQNPQCYVELANILILEASHVFEHIKANQITTNKQLPNVYSITEVDPTTVNTDLLLDAIVECNKALEINPSLGMAYFHRAQARYLLGNSNYCEDVDLAGSNGVANPQTLLGIECP